MSNPPHPSTVSPASSLETIHPATPPTPASTSPSPTQTSSALARLLAGLTSYVQAFDRKSMQKGRTIARRPGAVHILDLNDNVIGAHIAGSAPQPYVTTLRLGREGWLGECSCPVGYRCKHIHALGIALIETRTDLLARLATTAPAGSIPASAATPIAPATASKPRKKSFRETWAPLLAEKIGRPLTQEENHLLSQLSAAFSEVRNRNSIAQSRLKHYDLAPDPNVAYSFYDYSQAFEGYWPYGQGPADPWAFWQYLAYDWQRAGRPLPEAFLPMTDLTSVRGRLEALHLAQEVETWRKSLQNLKRGLTTQPPAHTPAPNPELAKSTDLRLQLDASLRRELQILVTTPKAKAPAWRAATNKWFAAFQQASPADWAHYPEPARHLALALRLHPRQYGGYGGGFVQLSSEVFTYLLQQPATHPAIFLPDGTPLRIEPAPLHLSAHPLPDDPSRLGVHLVLPDGTPLRPQAPSLPFEGQHLYLWQNRLWLGPPAPPPTPLPVAALAHPEIADDLHTLGVILPASLQARFQTVSLPPFLRLWVENSKYDQDASTLRATLHARSAHPPCAQEWSGYRGWRWLPPGPPPSSGPDAPHYHFDLASAKAIGARFGDFRFSWWDGEACWARPIGRDFPEEFIAWRATLPADLELEVSPDLAGLLGAPIRAHLSVSATPATDSGLDWFDLHLEFKVEDLTLTPEEITLLLKARGKWVRLPSRGWQRLQVEPDETSRAHLARLGLSPGEDLAPGQRSTHRFHALQLADAALADEALAARLRARAAELRALPLPPLPDGLRADLRPYQLEGYHFLAHLSAQGLGGVLADDMGLGKTVQTLAWLLRLAQTEPDFSNLKSEVSNPTDTPTAFRALVICPKSVVPNWRNEALRFAPSLTVAVVSASDPADTLPTASLLVLNYAQLRLRADLLATIPWHAVILDEGQNIKNPASATARAACALPARHRLVLTGTPIENRLLDLWSLLHFAQPGLLGSQASFQRLYNDKTDPEARARLATRVRPFLLRRTKAQVAKDLPPRIEEEIECELEGTQRALYEAELKRARQMLVAVKTARQFDAQRFNILQSLLRLRQICCDPRLVGLDPSADQPAATVAKKRGRPSKKAAAIASTAPTGAKLEALIETLEPLVAEGHRVLVFSQFVTMLELIRAELTTRDIGHLLLTGQTENRQELVDRFQAPDGPPVFLLSLKAAGAGLNLTAASYVVLFDPWWNPAVEAQAIDRTHRIGQANTVIAYRLIAKDTVEQKIRALQREKAALAAAVVQEESLATVMDLENLRRILA